MAAQRIRIAFSLKTSLKTLGSVLILLALSASGANAIPVEVNPGTPGNEVDDFSFVVPIDVLTVDLVFTDMKTLTWGPGLLTFAITASPGGFPIALTGWLNDQSGNMIADTDFSGTLDGGITEFTLSAQTVWSGMHFESGFVDEKVHSIIWTSQPIVGVIPEPSTALLFGFGLVGLGMRRKRAA